MRGLTYYQSWLAPREVGITNPLSMKKSVGQQWKNKGLYCMQTKKTWMDLFQEYFKRDVVLEGVALTITGEHLYRKGFSFPLLKCLDTDKAKYVMREVHEEPVATISAKRVKRFYWKRLICHFRLPTIIVSNNGTQFASRSMAEFYS
ncbi:hypothetical protein CR513_48548, partial [Mucuna pruriens]